MSRKVKKTKKKKRNHIPRRKFLGKYSEKYQRKVRKFNAWFAEVESLIIQRADEGDSEALNILHLIALKEDRAKDNLKIFTATYDTCKQLEKLEHKLECAREKLKLIKGETIEVVKQYSEEVLEKPYDDIGPDDVFKKKRLFISSLK